MNIKIICVGKLKEKYLKQGIEEYSKRLKGYVKLEIIEVNDEKIPQNASLSEEEKVKDKEGEKILQYIKEKDYVFLLDVKSKQYDSIEFANQIHQCMLSGSSTIDFVIGGSLGHGKKVYQRANQKISMSNHTFPHQLFRLMLLEQIYRSFKIINNETYHK